VRVASIVPSLQTQNRAWSGHPAAQRQEAAQIPAIDIAVIMMRRLDEEALDC
jgi:hypothetical protein